MDDAQKSIDEDEVIFSARYSVAKLLISMIVAFIFPMVMLFGVAYPAILEEKYLRAGFAILIASALLFVYLESVFSEQLLFYQNRVVKRWYLFGRRAIHYSNASVTDPEWYIRWLSSGHYIFESREKWKTGSDALTYSLSCFFLSC